LGVEEPIANVYLGERVRLFGTGIYDGLAMQRIHVDYPAEIIYVRRIKPIKIARLVNFITFDGGFAHRFDFDLDIVLREFFIRRNILVGDHVVSAVLKSGPLDPDAQSVLVIANCGDFAPLPVLVKANNSKAGESD
jgi:hypothetical protein